MSKCMACKVYKGEMSDEGFGWIHRIFKQNPKRAETIFSKASTAPGKPVFERRKKWFFDIFLRVGAGVGVLVPKSQISALHCHGWEKFCSWWLCWGGAIWKVWIKYMTCFNKGDWSRVWVSGVRLAIRGTGTPTVAPPTLAEEYSDQTTLCMCWHKKYIFWTLELNVVCHTISWEQVQDKSANVSR